MKTDSGSAVCSNATACSDSEWAAHAISWYRLVMSNPQTLPGGSYSKVGRSYRAVSSRITSQERYQYRLAEPGEVSDVSRSRPSLMTATICYAQPVSLDFPNGLLVSFGPPFHTFAHYQRIGSCQAPLGRLLTCVTRALCASAPKRRPALGRLGDALGHKPHPGVNPRPSVLSERAECRGDRRHPSVARSNVGTSLKELQGWASSR
jgi:hypothetical protein